jgi:hypothetical protein
MWPRWLADALNGKVSLARAFWLYGLGISLVYSLIGLLVQSGPVAVIYVLVGLALGVLQTIIVWRCADNSRFRFLGRLVRIATVFGVVLLAIMLYVLFTNPGLLAAS